MLPLRLFAMGLVVWAAVPAMAAERIVPLKDALKRADAVVLATIDDPATDQTVMPIPGADDFVRLQWRLRVAQVLVGKTGKKLKIGSIVRVDETQWRGDLEARRHCRPVQAADGSEAPCPMPEKDAYASELAREPRPRQPVLALLKWTPDGWQLALERAMDLPERASQVRRRPR